MDHRAEAMPMLPPLFAVYAARRGDRSATTRWLAHAVEDYSILPFLLPDEHGRSRMATKARVGPSLAHAGALVPGLLLGLTGLAIDGDSPHSPQHQVGAGERLGDRGRARPRSRRSTPAWQPRHTRLKETSRA